MKIRIQFNNSTVQDPIIAETILKTKIPVNIEQANIDGDEGWALLTIDDDKDVQKFLATLSSYNVKTQIQRNAITHDINECVDCGFCISICQKHVFSFDENWTLKVNESRCVLCGRCAAFCPQRALSIQTNE